LTLDEVQEIASAVYDVAHEEANIIFGTVIKPEIQEEIFVTVIATGFEEKEQDIEIEQTTKWIPKPVDVSLKQTKRIIDKDIESLTSFSKSVSLNNVDKKEESINKDLEKQEIIQEDQNINYVNEETAETEIKMNKEEKKSENTFELITEPSKEIPADIEDDEIPAYLKKKHRLFDEKNI
jgi:Cell division GTPase